MEDQSRVDRLTSVASHLPGWCGGLMIALGLTTLAGWAFDVSVLRSLLPGAVSMNPWTALLFVAAGAAITFLREPSRPSFRNVAAALAGSITLFAIVKLIGIASGRDFGLDRTMFRALLDATPGLPPNRMAPNTALGFLLLGAALLLDRCDVGRARASQFPALGLLLIAFLALVGYAYGVRAFYGVYTYIPMALTTAIGFALAATGVFFLHPDRGAAARLLSPDSGGRLLRVVLPTAVVASGVIGWTVLVAERAKLIDGAFGMSAMVVTSVIVLTGAVWVIALSLARSEEGRNRAAADLRVALELKVARGHAALTATDQSLRHEIARRELSEATLVKVTRAIEQTADLILMTDREGRIEYVNPAFERQTGYTFAELDGKTPKVLRSGEHDAGFYANMWRTLEAGEVFHAVFLNRKKSGETYHEQKSISPIRDAEGNITHYVSTGADVTDRVRLERQLQQSQKLEAVGRLAGGISHDFNNLLTVILGFGGMAIEDAPEGSPIREKLLQIQQAGERAAVLTRRLLAFSRQQVFHTSVLDLNHIVGEMDPLLRRLIGEHIDLRTELAKDLGMVKADGGQLEQVLMNLVVNARDAMPKGGQLTIETANVTLDAESIGRRFRLEPGDYVAMIVTDSGVGMDIATLSQIFEPFFTTKDQAAGTGLGLSIVHGIVSQSGGHIDVYSEPGRGASFKVYLPRVRQKAAVAPAETGPKRRLDGTETILLVEDEELVRALATEALKSRGYRVLVAAGGPSALAYADSSAPIDLLISDVVLPGMSGPDVCAAVIERRPRTPVLFISGYTDRSLFHRGLIGPETPYLQKPFTAIELLERVRQLLDAGKPERVT